MAKPEKNCSIFSILPFAAARGLRETERHVFINATRLSIFLSSFVFREIVNVSERSRAFVSRNHLDGSGVKPKATREVQ